MFLCHLYSKCAYACAVSFEYELNLMMSRTCCFVKWLRWGQKCWMRSSVNSCNTCRNCEDIQQKKKKNHSLLTPVSQTQFNMSFNIFITSYQKMNRSQSVIELTHSKSSWWTDSHCVWCWWSGERAGVWCFSVLSCRVLRFPSES